MQSLSVEAISLLRAISDIFTFSPALPQRQEMFGLFFFFYPSFTMQLSPVTHTLWPERWINERRALLFKEKEMKMSGRGRRSEQPRVPGTARPGHGCICSQREHRPLAVPCSPGLGVEGSASRNLVESTAHLPRTHAHEQLRP